MLTLPKIFASGMVLQRQKPIRIWGNAVPGELVTVCMRHNKVCGTADKNGAWRIELPALEASSAETLTVSTGKERIELTGIAVGEVWIAGGQSNMEFWLRYEKHREQEQTDYPELRFYDVPKIAYDGQDRDFDYSQMAVWRKAIGEERGFFSAVGYYFQKKVSLELDVPVGIIGCNWGGTASCSWMSAGSVERAAPVWIEWAREAFSGIDMAGYWEKQARNPENAAGDLFRCDFNQFMLPSTPEPRAIDAFLAERPPADPALAALPPPQSIPGALYEHMVKTAAPFPIRGVLWYQGESDDGGGRGGHYGAMLTALVRDWREIWQEDLPFLIVQLPGWESWFGFVNEGFPVIRQCQQAAADADASIYLCSISDAGERLDIHPKDKKVVGERLALLALGHIYGRDILCDPPRLKNVSRDGERIVLTFAGAGTGLWMKGEKIAALEIRNSRGPVAYSACIKGSTILVTLPENTGKVTVDFARTPWYLVNLYNSAGLPAIPFSVEC